MKASTLAFLLLAGLAAGTGDLPGALAQSPPVTPDPAPPAGPAPAAPAVPAPPAAPAVPGRPTLIGQPGDPGNVDEVVLPAKPVLILAGKSGWADGLKNLQAAFTKLEAELSRLGVAPAGRPIAAFIETRDDDFRFEAMIPVAAAPDPAPTLGTDMRFGTTPSGKAYRFVHKGLYDDIETTYETITTYLEAKDLAAQDTFLEEFVTDPAAGGTDPNTEVNIFVLPK